MRERQGEDVSERMDEGRDESGAISAAAVRWLIEGEQGLSSRAIFDHLALGRPVDPYHYPHDLDDWQRCERLLRAVPELRPHLVRMAGVGHHWRPLIEVWTEVARLLDEDAPGLCDIGWRAIAGTSEDRSAAIQRGRAVFDEAYERAWADSTLAP